MIPETDPPAKAPARRKKPVRDRVVELVRIRAGELAANPSNWKIHPPKQRAALRGLLKEVGYADALLARRTEAGLVLIDGHLRQSLDPDQVVPVLVLDVDECEADTLLASLDPLASLDKADPDALAALLERVQTSSAAVSELLDSVRRGAGLPAVKLHAGPDEAPPLPVIPRTKRGDLFLLGDQRLLCGDATSEVDMARLMGGERADALWTDPPYGVDYTGKTPEALTLMSDDTRGLDVLLAEAFARADEVLKEGAPIYVCHPAGRESMVFTRAFCEQGWTYGQGLVWAKDRMVLGHSDYHYRHEPILYGHKPGPARFGRGFDGWYGGDDQDSLIEVPRPGASREHPTMKPVELIRRCLVNGTSEGQVVLDPFAGSGSSLIAAHMMGRRGFGMELDPLYCDVIIDRFEAVTGEVPRRARE